MTRDWDIIREILLKLEESKTPNTVISMGSFEGRDEQEVAYNIRLLSESDCIVAMIRETSTGDNLIGAAIAKRLTPLGHDLLDSIRNDSVWIEIQDKLKSKGLDMTIDLVIKVGKQIMDALLF